MSVKEHGHGDLICYHQRIQQVHGSADLAFFRAHLGLMHGLDRGQVRLPWARLEELHRRLHGEAGENQMSGPTPADRAAGTAAAIDMARAETLRKLARRVYDMSHAEIGPEAHEVEIVDLQTVTHWLLGWATRIQHGEEP